MMADQGNSIKILFIGDDLNLRDLVQEEFESDGWPIEVAADIRTGLIKLNNDSFDLVMIYLRIPEEELLHAIQRLSLEFQNTPVIVITHPGNEMLALRGLESGARDYIITDPQAVYLEILTLVINQVLQQKSLKDEIDVLGEALQESESRCRKLMEKQGEGVCILNLDQTLKYANPALEIYLHQETGEMVGKKLDELMDRPDQAFFHEQLERTIQGEKRCFELDLKTKDGENRAVALTATPLFDILHDVINIQINIEDKSHRKRNEAVKRYFRTHDTLTGLYNRDMFEAELTRFDGGRMYPLTIVKLDVNDLKRINDTQGFAAGDELLRRTAKLLKATFRFEDIVARTGGDEFTVLLPGVNDLTAILSIRRLKDRISVHNQTYPNDPLSLSIGMATALDKNYDLAEVEKKAEELMYKDKVANKSSLKTTI